MTDAAVEGDEAALIGRMLGDGYRVTARLGVGAMGTVYEAEQVRLKRTVAIKVLADKYRDNIPALRRFHNEARALVLLDHPHVVRIIDFALSRDGRPFLVMERLHGSTVGHYLESGRRFSVATTIAIARQVCDALVEAHSKGIFHRDLKPDNLFLVDLPNGGLFVKVVDFGISLLPSSEAPRITSENEVVGTPEYMSPEQALGLGDRVNGCADQHGLALVMYEMLSGVSPFASQEIDEALERVSFEMPQLLHHLAPAVPPGLSRVLHRALSKDPQERYPGIDAFIAAAEGAVQAEVSSSEIAVPGDSATVSIPVARTFSVDDPVRTMALLLARARRASLAGDTSQALELATTALDSSALTDDEAVLAVIEMARPLFESIFHSRLEPMERRVAVSTPGLTPARLSDAQAALLAAVKPQSSIAEIIHAASLPRIDALRALVELEAQGTVEFRPGVPRPRSRHPEASTSRPPVSAPVIRLRRA